MADRPGRLAEFIPSAPAPSAIGRTGAARVDANTPEITQNGKTSATRPHTCPISGRIVASELLPPQYRRVLERRSSYDDLIDHLMRSTALPRGEAARVILDVLAYFDETTDAFVRRRHRELQSGGLVNTEIFERISAELPHRAVAPPELSLRQLRRIVYG